LHSAVKKLGARALNGDVPQDMAHNKAVEVVRSLGVTMKGLRGYRGGLFLRSRRTFRRKQADAGRGVEEGTVVTIRKEWGRRGRASSGEENRVKMSTEL